MSTLASSKRLTVPLSERVISPAYSGKEDFEQLVLLASRLYKERLSSVPFYKDRMHDEHFWTRFVGSRVKEAQALVASSTKARGKRSRP
ncbi:hypothetical protein [Ramlibacter albus]|uniref:Uncharacterized protein n=1 Tax=Ramlibacter albus TaxID=2079448 RepID=A0A923M9Y2_9BURK|nr:hypothetical protein [Ramlibacter albus]MBC5765598.1 hypothetical protein [Ramlibacter albus]